jgi:hypothetical protein
VRVVEHMFRWSEWELIRTTLDYLKLDAQTGENDVWGANRVGMPALHVDPLGLYEGWPGECIRDLSLAPEWLDGYSEDDHG